MLSLMAAGGFGADTDSEPGGGIGIPVDTTSSYEYNSTAEISPVRIADFKLEVENNTYTVSRSDNVPNSGTSLRVKEAHVVGDTLVIEEEFVDTTDDTVNPTSELSTGAYQNSWQLELDIDTVAVEHPYKKSPYIEEL